MLNWISERFGRKPGGTAGDDATSAWLARLAQTIERRAGNSQAHWPDRFAERVVDHLATGGSTSVLTEADALRKTASTHSDLGNFYEGFDEVDPVVALRWAKLLALAWQAQSGRGYSLVLPNGSRWAESLMLHASSEQPDSYRWYGRGAPTSPLRADTLERLLVADGMAPESVLVASFNGEAAPQATPARGFSLIARAPDYAHAVARHLEHLRGAFVRQELPHRMHLIALLADVDDSALNRLGHELAEMSVSTSKQVRQGARPLASKGAEAVVAPLRRHAVEGSPEQRLHALERLNDLAAERANAALANFARETAAVDKAPSVRALAARWLADASEGPGDEVDEIQPPAIDWSAAANAVAADTLAEFWKLVDVSIEAENKRAREWRTRQGTLADLKETPPFPAAMKAALASYLASPDILPASTGKGHVPHLLQHVREAIVHVAPRLTPVAGFKLLRWLDLFTDDDELGWAAVSVFNAMHKATRRPTLLELAQILADAGLPAGWPLRSYCATHSALGKDWQADAVGPYVTHQVAAVEALLLSPPRHAWFYDSTRLFRAISMVSRPPARVIDTLFRTALGSAKTDRPHAQAALAALPGKEERITAALADGKADVRQFAAEWLGRLRHLPAQAALEKAVAKERNDLAKGAMLDALQALGQPVEKYIDRAAIAREAPKSFAKGLPKDVEWFPWEAMPPVHWADNGEPVPPDVLRWLVVQAVKQKSPEPNAVLRKLCAMMVPRDREAFGQFVLESWMHEDTRPHGVEAATASARAHAAQMHGFMQRSPQYFKDSPHLGKSLEELVAAYLPGFLRQPAGSAIGSKGMLAIAAACAGERATAAAQRYVKLWYGTRAAQGKALIAMLAWIEHPSATQLMLSIGSRFRTKSFQEEATRQAQLLAERKGWTLAELADRTIPSAGFDESGTLELSYGERAFTARLLPDFKVELSNPDGKKIAALPEPRMDDDAEAAKDAKKAFSAAKKELKGIVDLQTDRLHEALCTQRDWPAADWLAYLQRHPVMRHLVQRLAWNEVDTSGAVTRTFRPLDDDTLTDVDDEEVVLHEGMRVRLAHDSNLPPEAVRAWQQHLADYAIKPLFQQFGKGGYRLPAELADATAIKDFEGHLVEAFALRGRALKLGWTRGPAEDGGWFHVYEKRFPTLGLQAVLEFTGNPLPESNRTVALVSLSFLGTEPAGNRGAVPLSSVPAVLLSECHDDMRLVAAEGTGFDAEWQKKTEY